MSLSASRFAAAVEEMRPRLIQAARQLRRCTIEEAEDLVSDAVVAALEMLPRFDERSGYDGLRRWLIGILDRIVQRSRRETATQVETVALTEEVVMACAGPPEERLPAAGALELLP